MYNIILIRIFNLYIVRSRSSPSFCLLLIFPQITSVVHLSTNNSTYIYLNKKCANTQRRSQHNVLFKTIPMSSFKILIRILLAVILPKSFSDIVREIRLVILLQTIENKQQMKIPTKEV